MSIIVSVSYAQVNSLTQVTYTHPEKFTDFETQLGARDRLDRLKKDLNRNINKLWKKTIANGDSLTINFTDIDMAGRIIFGIDQIREVRVDSDKSVLEFDFIIKNKNGKVIKSGHEKLVNNNLARLDRNTFRFENSRLKYEVAQMASWIKELSQELIS
jgi:hypothetical protein